MRIVAVAYLASVLAGSELYAQEAGSIEVGFFGSSRRPVASGPRTSAARVTVFVTRRLAVEIEQELGGLGRGTASGGLWGVLAVPLGSSLRFHTGPGIALTDPSGSSASSRRLPEPGVIGGARWAVYDWLGVRLDGQLLLKPARSRRADGEGTPPSRSRTSFGVYGGFSLRVRG